ncbi:MAG: UDP-N-acetylmuramate--L-alanine ligase [Bacteroidota bacterium]
MTAKTRRRQPAFGQIRQVHMVGIGGIGMSSIAEVLLARGYRVTGSDLKLSDVTEHLTERGAIVYEGHDAAHVGEADVVVYSSAVKPAANPETLEAEGRRLPLISRAVMLGELMRMQFGIGIAGTHGKTTTTTLTGLVVGEGGFDPTIIVGGKVSVFGSNAVSGEGDIIIIEADEYDRTFLRLTPSLAVITNIEADHLDIYADLDDIKAAFAEYANSVPFFGATIVCLDDPQVQAILGQMDRRIITYGTTRQAQVRAERITQEGLISHFSVYNDQEELGRVSLQAPGLHNVRNALAAIAVGLELQMGFDDIMAGLARFSGVQRRFHLLGEVNDVLLVDDYAHHPTEVAATLAAASAGWRDRRIVAVFQPHLYSRTRDFQDAFARAFFNADVLVVTEVYPAREAPIEGVGGHLIADLARRYGHRDVHYVPDKHDLPAYVADLACPGDTLITMGAGDIWRISRALLDRLTDHTPDG